LLWKVNKLITSSPKNLHPGWYDTQTIKCEGQQQHVNKKKNEAKYTGKKTVYGFYKFGPPKEVQPGISNTGIQLKISLMCNSFL
jgi:hypothetical protein